MLLREPFSHPSAAIEYVSNCWEAQWASRLQKLLQKTNSSQPSFYVLQLLGLSHISKSPVFPVDAFMNSRRMITVPGAASPGS